MVRSILPLLHNVDLPSEVIYQGHWDVIDVLLAHDALPAWANDPPQIDSECVVLTILINSTRPRALDVGQKRVLVDIVADNSQGITVRVAERDVRHVLCHQCANVLDTVVRQHLAQPIRS